VLETVVFAMIAAFLGLRLYSVLGKRTGHEQPIGKPTEVSPADPVRSKRTAVPVTEDGPERINAAPSTDASVEARADTGIRAIMSADSRFNPAEFLEGAQSAYQMILEDFWKGDVAGFTPYVGEDVAEAFKDAIAARNKAGETLDNRLVRIERASISEAAMIGKVARVTVRFDADIAAVTRDKKGRVVAGSLSDAVLTHDAWVFERDVKSSDPNWILVDTDEAV
jgi:predicted lipid-binding transport protein (Tim44 family)